MRPHRFKIALLVLALAAFAGFAAGCGTEHETEVKEGEPLELDGVAYNIQITRYLNPYSPEDSTYLRGAPKLGDDQQYLGVFMEIINEGDEAGTVPELEIVDTRGTVFKQIELAENNPFALQTGMAVPVDGTVPGPETVAASGSIEGLLALFIIDVSANENRPLLLEVPSGDVTGEIELDI